MKMSLFIFGNIFYLKSILADNSLATLASCHLHIVSFFIV